MDVTAQINSPSDIKPYHRFSLTNKGKRSLKWQKLFEKLHLTRLYRWWKKVTFPCNRGKHPWKNKDMGIGRIPMYNAWTGRLLCKEPCHLVYQSCPICGEYRMKIETSDSVNYKYGWECDYILNKT